MLVSDSLLKGKDNAQTARELSNLFNCTPRDIQRHVETSRRQGKPICASVKGVKGFYLATDPEELESYCQSLDRRLEEIKRTRNSLKQTLIKWRQGEQPK